MEKIIFNYFPELNSRQKSQIEALAPLYSHWNSKINLISRKDIDNLYLHHILHSLAIAKRVQFADGATILDVGTGGGFPGIPLAILFPKANFFLCDSINKKIGVVNEIKEALELKNVVAKQIRAENIEENFDFVVSRAVTELSKFLPWIWDKINRSEGRERRGVLYLKGGDLESEIALASKEMKIALERFSLTKLSEWFREEWFREKQLLFIER